MSHGTTESATGRASELSLFAFDVPPHPSVADGDDPLDVIAKDLDAWDRLCLVADGEPRWKSESERLRSLGRDLKALRDCFLAAGHPRIQAALLREAEDVSRRMQQQARRLRVPGTAIRLVPSGR